jgi:hypothetical protein
MLKFLSIDNISKPRDGVHQNSTLIVAKVEQCQDRVRQEIDLKDVKTGTQELDRVYQDLKSGPIPTDRWDILDILHFQFLHSLRRWTLDEAQTSRGPILV